MCNTTIDLDIPVEFVCALCGFRYESVKNQSICDECGKVFDRDKVMSWVANTKE